MVIILLIALLLMVSGAMGQSTVNGGGSNTFGAPFPGSGVPIGFKTPSNTMGAGLLDLSGNLLVDIAAGSITISGGTSTVNQGTSPWIVGGTVTANQGGTWTVQQGTPPWSVSQSGTWNVGLNAGSNNIGSVNQGTNPWIVGGTVMANQGGAPWSVSETFSQLPQGEVIAPLPTYGPASNGVPAQNTVEIAAFYSPNPPTVQKGQATRLQTDGNGNLLTRITQPLPPSPVNIQDAVGLRPVYGPCLYLARQTFNINTSSNVLIATGSATKKIAVCDWSILPAAAAVNVALVEGTTGICTVNTTGMQGGPTAASGANVALNGGFIQAANPNGDPWGITATQGDSVCLFVSAAVAGVINFVGPF